MNDKKISIIIPSNDTIYAIASLVQQNNNLWECFIINNSVKDIEQYIINDHRFKLLKDTKKNDPIKTAIHNAKGEYILFVNSTNILVNDAIDNILHIIDFTNADIIKFNSQTEKTPNTEDNDNKCEFNYIPNKNKLIDYIYDNICEFCFKKDIVSDIDMHQSAHTMLTSLLLRATDMSVTQKICLIRQNNNNLSVSDVIDNYINNHDKLPKIFWKKYFKNVTPQIVSQTTKSNDKKSFINFCSKIPLNLIPLRYRFICYILRQTNEIKITQTS